MDESSFSAAKNQQKIRVPVSTEDGRGITAIWRPWCGLLVGLCVLSTIAGPKNAWKLQLST